MVFSYKFHIVLDINGLICLKSTILKKKISPPLAWCLVFDRNGNVILHHGSFVESFEGGFFEGGWDGKVCSLGFDQSHFFLGSGGKLVDDEIIISTPGHVLERLYSTRVEGKLYFSNSFPFILSRSGQALKNNYYCYESDFASILKGVGEYKRKIPTEHGEVGVYYIKNLKVDRALNVVEVEKPRPPIFSSYEDYIRSLDCYLEKLRDNLQDPSRKNNFDFCTTISNGYDAAASAAKAAEFGCDISCSFNSPEKYKNDDGRDISKALGFKRVEFRDASTYIKRDDAIEAEFLSSGELGTGIVFSAFEDLWPKKAVFMGERGDKIWDKNWPDVNDEMRVNDEVFAGTSMIENRLRVGYMLVPLPLYGALSWSSIACISNSEDMKPFSIGGGYDRPIPRRVLEEKGVLRSSFGIKKRGAGFNYRYDSASRLKKRMSQASLSRFNNFVIEHGRGKRNLQKGRLFLEFVWANKFLYGNKFLQALKLPKVFPSSGSSLVCSPGVANDLIRWGVYETAKRYEAPRQ